MTILGVLLIHYDSIVAGSSIPSDQFFNRLSKVSIKDRVIDQTAEGADEH